MNPSRGQRSGALTYTIGFVLSLVLTFAAYLMVTHHTFAGWTLTIAILILALAQLFVQLKYFLHLGQSSKDKWDVSMFWFMVLTVMILVVGSLWIMHNLDYNMSKSSSSDTINTQMMQSSDEGF